MKERATVVIVALLHYCITCEGDNLSVKLFCSYTVTAGCLDLVEIPVAIPVRKLLGRDKEGRYLFAYWQRFVNSKAICVLLI